MSAYTQDDDTITAFDWPRPTDEWTKPQLEHAKAAIEDRMLVLTNDIANIQSQLRQAEQVRADTGQFADPAWWRRASHAKRMTGREHQRCAQLLGDINRRIKRRNVIEQNEDTHRRFIATARAMLPAETYEAIWTRVNAEGPQIIETPKEN